METGKSSIFLSRFWPVEIKPAQPVGFYAMILNNIPSAVNTKEILRII